MEATLAAPGPLDVPGTLARFHLWGEDPANRLADGVFRRAVRVDGRWHGYELRWAGGPDDARLTVRVPGARGGGGGGAGGRAGARARVGWIGALALARAAFYRAAGREPVLGALVPRLYGLR